MGSVNDFRSCECLPESEQITFDASIDSFPIVANSCTDLLNIDVINISSNLDFTNQLPTNLKKGSRVIIRKIETNRFRLIYEDGIVSYKYIQRKGEYIELIWIGNKYII